MQSMQLVVTSCLLDQIRKVQVEAVKNENWRKERVKGQVEELVNGDNGLKTRFGRVWVPNTCGAKNLLLDEAHRSRYSVYPRATKMYRDLKTNYFCRE